MFHRHNIATLKDLLQQAAVIVVGKHNHSGMQLACSLQDNNLHQHKVKPSQP
jgi:hypothetical protein